MSVPALYLIPCPIAEAALFTLSAQAIEVARHTEIFIVERAKTARHFIKSLGPVKPLPALTFLELPQTGIAAEAIQIMKASIQQGKNVGVLSEAGCPGVADPGSAVVAAAHQAGIRVVPLSGPSSILLALMASGMNGQQFAFHGYLSPKRPELARDLKRLEQMAAQKERPTQIFIETPYRSQMVLEVALASLSPHTAFGVAQALTGPEEQILVRSIQTWKKMPVPVLHKAPAVFLVGHLQG
jgi:16S rRNA (cytidine1402-2'-O)-methyltransferase